MLDPQNPFYVVTVGRMYQRYEPQHLCVGGQMQHARRYGTVKEAREARDFLKDNLLIKKKVGIQRVHIEAIE